MNLTTGTADLTAFLNVQDRDINVLAQVHSTHDYVNNVHGFDTSPVRIARGGIADFVALGGVAFAPCMGHWVEEPGPFGTPDPAFLDRWGSPGGSVPFIPEGAGPLMASFHGIDIVIPNTGVDDVSRGIATHEYGHYVFCDILSRTRPDVFDRVWIEIAAQTLIGQLDGDPPPALWEGAVINEAFADYIASQAAGGTNWFWLNPAAGQGSLLNDMFYCNPVSLQQCMEDNLGGAGAITPAAAIPPAMAPIHPFHNAVGRSATMLHDIFDGNPVLPPANVPNNGYSWIPAPAVLGPAGTFLPGSFDAPDFGDENVVLDVPGAPASPGGLLDGFFLMLFDFDAGWEFVLEQAFFHGMTRSMRTRGVAEADIVNLYTLHGPVPPTYLLP